MNQEPQRSTRNRVARDGLAALAAVALAALLVIIVIRHFVS
jgi:hypothetical protein